MFRLFATSTFYAFATGHAKPFRVPGGHVVDSACIVELANGASYNADEPQERSAACKMLEVAAPQIQIYAADVHVHSSTPIKSFTADWTVPALPKTSRGQVVYFWPGFKSKQPEMGYPVLQPVLQYGEHGAQWQLQSWFVDARSIFYPVVTAPAIKVSPGDQITSYMGLGDDGKTWTVSGSNTRTGLNSTLHIAHSRAGNCDYDYAMLVNENINVNRQCNLMPAADSVTFTNVKVDGKQPQWTMRANCAGNAQCDCGNNASVSPKGDVTLSWKAGNGGTVV